MSVDKFGRYSSFGEKPVPHGKRGGLPLTSDGDYDIGNKRLKFVKDPTDEKDAINLQTLKSETSKTTTLENYVKNNCVLHGVGSIDCKGNVLTNVKGGSTPTDVATMNQVMTPYEGEWYGKNYKITGVLPAEHNSDVVIYDQVPVLGPEGIGFNCKGKALVNIGHSTIDSAAVRRDQFVAQSLRCEDNTDTYNAKNKRIREVLDPIHVNDAVNVNFLVRLLGNIMFDFYNMIPAYPKNTVGPGTPAHDIYENIQNNRDLFINDYIVQKYFISPKTKVFRSSNWDFE